MGRRTASLRQTTLMVTPQLEDLAEWDVIWVMQDGRIVIDQGRYAELSVAGGPFATLLAIVRRSLNARFAAPIWHCIKRHKWMLSQYCAGNCDAARQYRSVDTFRLVPLGLSGCGGCRTVQLQLYATRCGRAWCRNPPVLPGVI